MSEDWTKFVTLNPPNEVKFKFSDAPGNEESQIELDNQKAVARIEIINKSKSAILFKVSTFTFHNRLFRSKQPTSRTTWYDPMPRSSQASIHSVSRS